jgi:hypothetical protein
VRDRKLVVKLPAAKTDKFFGVALFDAAAGEQVDICCLGKCGIKLLGTESTLGALLIGGTDGKALTADAATGANQYPIARLLQAGTADEIVEALIIPNAYQAP